MGDVEIVGSDGAWPDAFRDVANRLWTVLGERAVRIDHIGSTSVPGLASKDVIDVQVSVERAGELDDVARTLEEAGWTAHPDLDGDHHVPGWSHDGTDRRKRFVTEPAGSRRVNVHIRVMGQPNQRYPLLFRDYLRTHPLSVEAYATFKRDLAGLLPNDLRRYAETKDAVCDLISFAAEDWATEIAWDPDRSDA